MAIVPDDKDWTWVLDRACADCGLDTRRVAPTAVADALRANLEDWVPVLDRPGVQERPAPDVWSPLEYACHVRDVYLRFDQRLALMLDQDDPRFENWDQDASATGYAGEVPSVVAGELRAAGEDLARRFDQVSGSQWERTGRRSDGAVFTVATLARYCLHDPVHHLHDVTRVA